MFLIILTACLIILLMIVVSSAIYLITLIVDESDDSNNANGLGLNVQDFCVTPVVSPQDLGRAEQRDDRDTKTDATTSTLTQALNEIATTSGNRANVLVDSFGLTPGDRSDATANRPQKEVERSIGKVIPEPSSSVDDTEKSGELNSTDQTTPSADTWKSTASTQKTAITNQLGASASKLLFDDFDPREVQLGGTGLHWCKSRKTVDKLIRLGVPLDLPNVRHETALHVAIRRHKLPILIGLLCHDANVESRNEIGETPLILACKMNYIFACQLLLVFDADPNALDQNGFSSRHHAAGICDRHKVQQPMPSAAHLILAMLHEMGARRCSSPAKDEQPAGARKRSSMTRHSLAHCTDGCSSTGTYDGNSYNRWSNFKRESLYRRHMFMDMLADRCEQKATGESKGATDGQQPVRSRLLCIDGGGLRGVIVCQMIIEIEKYLKKPMISYFDWVGGTSVGAFLACAFCTRTPLKELRRICFDVKDEVFSGNRPYNSKFIERVLKRTYGRTTRLSDVHDKKLAVTTVIADREPCQLRMFRNYKSPKQMLESFGYSTEKFHDLSGHSKLSTSSSRLRSSRKSSADSTSEPPPSSCASSKVPLQCTSTNEVKATSHPIVAQDNLITTSGGGAALACDTRASCDIVSSSSLDKRQVTSSATKNSCDATTVQSNLDTTGNNNKTSSRDKEDADLINEHTLQASDQDPLMWQAVRASAAAPFFFKPYGIYLDGGIISNNPTLDMLNEYHSYQKAREFIRRRLHNDNLLDDTGQDTSELMSEPPGKLDLVVSLGTGRGRVMGRQSMIDLGPFASGFATVFTPGEFVRSIRSMRDLFKKLVQQTCHTEDHILDRAQAWCASLDIPYFRINPPLASLFPIDDKRDEQLINALWQTKLYMRAMDKQLRELSQILDGDS